MKVAIFGGRRPTGRPDINHESYIRKYRGRKPRVLQLVLEEAPTEKAAAQSALQGEPK